MYKAVEIKFSNAYGVSLGQKIVISPLTRKQAEQVVRELNSTLPRSPQMRAGVGAPAKGVISRHGGAEIAAGAGPSRRGNYQIELRDGKGVRRTRNLRAHPG